MPYKTPSITSTYIRKLMPKVTDKVLIELLEYADENKIPVLLPESAIFLKQLVMLTRPKKVLEIGMAVGFSSQVILRNSDCVLYTIEMNNTSIEKAEEFFKKANLDKRVHIFMGDAHEIIPLIDGSFDFIFMDGPKTQYIEYLPYLKKLLVNGGTMLCDNVLFNGMVSGEHEIDHKKMSIVKKLDEFLVELFNDKDFTTSLLPVGDGLSLSIKNEKE